jgi:integrase
VNAGTYIDPTAGRVTFQTFATDWLNRQDHTESTAQAVEVRLRVHAFPVLGSRELRAIKPSTIQAWLRTLSTLAPATQRAIFVNVSTVFTAAVDDEVISKNPCSAPSVRRVRVEPRKLVVWEPMRVLAVRDALPERYAIIATIGAGLGLRQGEVFALSPDDVDWLRGEVTVRRQVKTSTANGLYFDLPKYGKVRTVPLPDSVRDALALHLATFTAVPVTLPWRRSDGKPETVPLIMTSRERKAINRNYFNSKIWKPALTEADVDPTRANGTHALRHFFASALLDAGESIKAVSEYLGHSDPGFTLRIYCHRMKASDKRSRAAIDAVFNDDVAKSVTDVSRGAG